MKIMVQIQATFFDDDNKLIRGGFITHVINLSNKKALDRLVEHFQGPALDGIPLSQDDCIVYDIDVDDKLLRY